MDSPIQVGEIGLRIAKKAWQGRRDGTSAGSFVGFVCDPKNLKKLFHDISATNVSEKQAHDLAIEYLKRFWSSDCMCSAIVANISMDKKQSVYLVRPVLEGAVRAGYGTDWGNPDSPKPRVENITVATNVHNQQ